VSEPSPAADVLTADAFGDFDAVGNDRLSPKQTPPVTKPEDEDDDDADYDPPTKSAAKIWDEKPSIAQQHIKAPDTIRLGAPVTCVLNLSIPADLATLNALQAKAGAWDGPFIVINELEKHFHEGTMHAIVTYTQIFYQKL
jgi:hypothetical protein